jgi:hypothetical protein
LLDPSHAGQKDRVFTAATVDTASGQIADSVEYSSYPSVRHIPGASLKDNSLLQFEVVCFCDIPMDKLRIHCAKYGHFGLGFQKQFLVGQGATPVLYVPLGSTFDVRLEEHHPATNQVNYQERKQGDRAQLMDELFAFHNTFLGYKRYRALQEAYRQAKSLEEVDEVVRKLRTMLFYQTAVEGFLFAYLKFFDPSLPPDHPDNYYMEREWRVAGRVVFQQHELSSVLVPEAFVERARTDLPNLAHRVKPIFETTPSNPAAPDARGPLARAPCARAPGYRDSARRG